MRWAAIPMLLAAISGCGNSSTYNDITGNYSLKGSSSAELLDINEGGRYVHRFDGRIESGEWRLGGEKGAGCLEIWMDGYSKRSGNSGAWVRHDTQVFCVERNIFGKTYIVVSYDSGVYFEKK